MKIFSESLDEGGPVPERCALGVPNADQHVRFGENLSPHIAWVDLPPKARSLALICHDPDVPSRPEDVNKEDRSVPASLPRMDFFHWVLVDIDPGLGELREAEFAQGVTARGKGGPAGPRGTRQGLNDYTQWFQGDTEMEGWYFGYDGPCPPWNDLILHHYHFTVFALDVERCPVADVFTGPKVRDAIHGHVLAEARLIATYSLNPAVPA